LVPTYNGRVVKWEYKMIPLTGAWMPTLNEMGEDGWELAWVFGLDILLKRQKA